jgi:Uri superfamily endonuclease
MRTYILILHLPADVELTIEPLGDYDLPAGYYAYVNSVPDSDLANRLRHHLVPVSSPQVAIDYIQQVTTVDEIWLSSGQVDHTHAWADLLIDVPGSIVLVEDFDVQDCDCDTHFFYFDVRPTLEDFVIGVRKRFPGEVVLRAYARQETEDEAETAE